MSRIALVYEIPFVDRVTMPARWARWLANQGQGNPALKDEEEHDGTITWEYAKHGLAPWMQFFYDWRFADLVNDPDQVNVLDGHGELIDSISGHLIYVFDLVGDSRVEAIVLTGVEPGMRLQIVTNDGPNPYPATNEVVEHRYTTQAMYNCTRY